MNCDARIRARMKYTRQQRNKWNIIIIMESLLCIFCCFCFLRCEVLNEFFAVSQWLNMTAWHRRGTAGTPKNWYFAGEDVIWLPPYQLIKNSCRRQHCWVSFFDDDESPFGAVCLLRGGRLTSLHWEACWLDGVCSSKGNAPLRNYICNSGGKLIKRWTSARKYRKFD